MNDKDFIRGFLDIKVAKICKDLDITPTNVYNGTVSKVKLAKIRKALDEEIAKLYERK